MQIPLEVLVGPVAGLAIALVVVWALWSEHKKADARDRADNADWKALATGALHKIGEQTEAITRLTTVVDRIAKRAK